MWEFFPISDAHFYLATVAILALCVLLFWAVGYDPRRAGRYLRSNARAVVLNALLVVAAVHALMLAPPPPADAYCVENHRVWGPMVMVQTCDSYDFVRTARHPGRLSMPGSDRQSRPLEIMVASLLTLVEVPNPESRSHSAPAETFDPFERKHDATPCQNCLQSYLGYPYGWPLQPGWLPYVIINFVLLLVSLMIFRRLNDPATVAAEAAVGLLGTFLIFNDVVKGFFWSAHTQMWNVLVPLISISLSLSLMRRPERDWRFMAAAGLLLGIGTLAYASLLICVPAAVAAIALGFRGRRERPRLPALFGKLCLFAAAYAAPTLIWIAVIKRKTGIFYSHEVEAFREYVWMLDSWRAGGAQALLRQTQVFVGQFLVNLWDVSWPVLVLLALALVAGALSPRRLRETIRQRSQILVASSVTLVLCLGFFALMGFYRNRLAFNAAVPLIVCASVIFTGLLERAPRRQAVVTVLLVAAAACGYITLALVRVTWPY